MHFICFTVPSWPHIDHKVSSAGVTEPFTVSFTAHQGGSMSRVLAGTKQVFVTNVQCNHDSFIEQETS